MKCAMPGMYGRKIPIESSTIRDGFIDRNTCKESNNNLTPEEIKKEFKAYSDLIRDDRKKFYISLGRRSGKTKLQEQTFEEFKEQLIQKDKEEHSQK